VSIGRFAYRRLLGADNTRNMLAWATGGFSLDASVLIAGQDRAGLEQLLRYRARPTFALERIKQVAARDGEQQVVYRLPKPQLDGRTELSLTSLEFIDHLTALIPPPRVHHQHLRDRRDRRPRGSDALAPWVAYRGCWEPQRRLSSLLQSPFRAPWETASGRLRPAAVPGPGPRHREGGHRPRVDIRSPNLC
jgi:hypothetical protein